MSERQIKNALRKKRIGLRYKYLPITADQVDELDVSVGPYQGNKQVDAYFERTLKRSRISLSLGRVIKPLTTARRVPSSQRFADQKALVDLKKCDGGWTLSPGGSAVVLTNEWVRLPHDLNGLIFPRVAEYHNGVVAVASYLDSTWRGLIKLHLTNSSGRAVRLRLGSEVARLFLFKAEGDRRHVRSSDEPLSEESVHHGLTWEGIIGSGTDPFPRRSAVRWDRFSTARLRNTNELIKNYSGYTIGALLIIGTVVGARLYRDLDTALGLGEAVEQVQQDLSDIRQEVARLNSHAVQSGVESITVPAGSTRGRAAVALPDDVEVGVTAFADAEFMEPQMSGAALTAIVRRNQNAPILELSVARDQVAADNTAVEVQWIVVP